MNFCKEYEKLSVEQELFKYNSLFSFFNPDKIVGNYKFNQVSLPYDLKTRKINRLEAAKKELKVVKDKFLLYNYCKIKDVIFLPVNKKQVTLNLDYSPKVSDFTKLWLDVKNSKLRIFLKIDKDLGNLNSLSLFLTAKNSKVYFFVTSTTKNLTLNHFTFVLNQSKLNMNVATFDKFSRHRFVVVGNKGSEASVKHVSLLTKDEKQDIYFEINSIGTSNLKVLSRAVAFSNSNLIVKGMAKIGKRATNSNSYLSLHALVMDKNAKAQALPMLEIENKDVRATHSASILQIDEEKLFYLMSRGLDEKKSKAMIAQTFLDYILRQMNDIDYIKGVKSTISDKTKGKIPIDLITLKLWRDLGFFEEHYKYR